MKIRLKKVDMRLPGKLPWREAGPPNHLDDKVDSDQLVVNKELSLTPMARPTPNITVNKSCTTAYGFELLTIHGFELGV